MSIALNGDGIISGVSSISNPDVTVGTGASVFSPAANTLALGTNGSERIRIDSSGNFGIGTNNPTVFGTAYRTVQLNPASGTGDGSAIRFMYDGGTANTNDLVIYTNSAQSYIRANGARNIDVMRNGSTVATFNANGIALPSGLGIDFSATSDATGMTSELLDDYEEGTWTPTWGGTSTYSTQTGKYIKIGNQVTIWFAVLCSSIGTGGSFVLGGLPFATASGVDGSIPLTYWQNINSSVYWLTAYAPGGGYTGLYFMGQQGLDATQEVNVSVGKSSAFVTGSGTYLVP